MTKGQVVWVPAVTLENGTNKRTAKDKYVECEVLEMSGVKAPSVLLERTDIVDGQQWVNKQMVEVQRPF